MIGGATSTPRRPGRRGHRRARLVACLTTVAALAGGCGGSDDESASGSTTLAPPTTAAATTTSTGPVPAGYTGFTEATSRFSVAVPSSWRQVDPSSPGAAQALQDLAKSNPALGSMLSGGDLAAEGIKFLAVDQAGASANVVVKPALGAKDSDLPQLLEELKAQYRDLGATLTGNETVKLAGHDVLKLSINLPLAQPQGGRTTLPTVQYFLVANDRRTS